MSASGDKAGGSDGHVDVAHAAELTGDDALRRRVDSLEAHLRTALERRVRAQRELDEARETVRLVWEMVRRKDRELAHLQEARQRPSRVRWPWRRSMPPNPAGGR
jgi:chromosome segregation ATPase